MGLRGRGQRGLAERGGPQALAPVQDVGQLFAIYAESVGGFFDGQPLANDEADGGPIQSGFGTGVVLVLHVARRVRPLIRGTRKSSMLRAIEARINRHLY